MLFKTIFRSLWKDKYSSSLYFLLLVLGLSGFGVILTVINHERDYDTSLEGYEKIYRATTYFERGDQEVKWAITNGYLQTILEEKLPEVDVATKFQTIQASQVLNVNGVKFDIPQREGFYTDPDFFDVLPYPLAQGIQSEALLEPNSIVISKNYAERFFGRTDVLGETITIEYPDDAANQILKVTGVLEEIPSNSFLQFNMLISGSSLDSWANYNSMRAGFPMHIFFRTNNVYDSYFLTEKLNEIANPIYAADRGGDFIVQFPVQQLNDIHYNADNLFEPGKPGNALFTKVLVAVGLVVLLISSVNYSILYITKSFARAKEIGIRKTLGSTNNGIIRRMLVESLSISTMSTILALFLAELILKSDFIISVYANDLSLLSNPITIMIIVVSGALLGIISGLYVSLKAMLFKTTEIIKGKFALGRTSFLGARNSLVILQFVLTAVMSVGSLMFLKQLSYIENKDLGYEKAAVISITKPSNVSMSDFNAFAQNLDNEPLVEASGKTLYDFLGTYNASGVTVIHEGDTASVRGQSNYIDDKLIEAMGMTIVEGRNFDSSIPSDSSAIIINEAARDKLGLDQITGKKTIGYRGGKIVGVVKNFHWQSFMNEIEPLMLYYMPVWPRTLMVRLNKENPQEAVARVKEKWDEVAQDTPFEPVYLDSSFGRLVESETKLSKVILAYTVMSILLACFGLVGIVRQTNQQRMKEIGIRKVYGASINSVLLLITGYFGKLVLIAIVVAIPLAIWGIDQWLATFAYRTEQEPLQYIIAILSLIGITYLVVILQTLKTANSNPVKVLKEE
jgi:putative ABC transport system permease protein